MNRDSDSFSYRDYVSDVSFNQSYNEYQDRYSEEIRFSDRKILELVGQALKSGAPKPRVLDVGCSTGNLLKHLNRTFPTQLQLTGVDLSESALVRAKQSPELADVAFTQMDITNLPFGIADIVIVNAVLYMMDANDFEKSLTSLANSLSSNGTLIVFDFAHSFPQELEIFETSHSHPDGLRLMFRSRNLWTNSLTRCGFTDSRFEPFEPSEDLPFTKSDQDLISYTVKAATGQRLLFRGALSQPWCHITAIKNG